MNNYMSNLECLGLIVGCLCHDLDHRGTNNAFQTKYVIISVKPTTALNADQFTNRQTWWALLTTVCWAFLGRRGIREKKSDFYPREPRALRLCALLIPPLLRERNLAAAGHVVICVNKLRSGSRPSTKFCWLDDEILSGVGRKFGSLYVYRKLPTYPSPKPALTVTSHLGQNVGLGEG